MKDLEKTLGGFIFVNLFPSLQYSIFPLPPGPFVSFLILGKQWTILRTKSENMCVWRKKTRQSKIWLALFSEISREVLQPFLLHITGKQLIRIEFVPTHVPELTHLQFIHIFWNDIFFGCIHQPTSGNCSNGFTHPTLSQMLYANRFLRKHRVSDLGGCGKNLI